MSDNTTPTDGSPTESTGPDSDRPAEYVADVGFDDLPMSDELRRAVKERGWAAPTPVQARAFQPVLDGRDLIVRSKTGTGKTAAFGLPLIQKLKQGERDVKALILCPTRELAMQVASELRELAKYKDLRVTAIYGGSSMKEQEDALEEGSAIVVGTPGRVYDHIRRKNLKLDTCTHGVLDEADEMLNQGFFEEVTRILDCLPKNRQVLLFSATVPQDIERLIAKYTTNAETILMSGDVFTVEHIHHIRYELSDAYPKPRNLIYVLEMEAPDNAIIFCNTRDDTSLVTAVLNRNGFDADLLNGDLPQKERERVMAKVKRGEVAFMVATDLAARGIDISGLQYVINYSLPEDPAVYLHRVGRTGRIGNKGTAINLTSGRELATLTSLEKKYGIKFEVRQMPTPEEAAHMWTERHVREIKEEAGSTVYDGFLPLAGEVRGRADGEDLIAFLLKYFFAHHRMDKAKESTTEEPAREERREERPRRERSERGERGERGEKRRTRGEERERPAREKRSRELEPGEGQVKLWIGLGKAHNVDDDSLRKALGDLGAPAEKLVAVDVRPTFSYALVTEEDAPAFEAVNGKLVADKPLKLERARPRDERPERREREPRAAEPSEQPGEVRLWVSLGKGDHLDEAGVQSALETAGAPAGKVVRVLMRPTYSYVIVREEDAGGFEALSGKGAEDKPLKIERSRGRGERPPRTDRPPDPPDTVRMWCSLSPSEGLDAASIQSTLESLGAPSAGFVRVSPRPTYSYVLVHEANVPEFEALNGKPHGEKTLKIERARPRR